MKERSFVKVGEIKISVLRVNVAGTIAAIPVVTIFGGVEVLLHGWPSPRDIELLWLLGAVLASGIIHELLHAVGYTTFAGLKWNEVKLGINWKALTPYCNCLSPVGLVPFRFVGLLPTLVLFPVSIALWAFYRQWWLAVLSAAVLVSGVGDFVVFLRTLGQPSGLYIVEHPSGIGGNLFACGARPVAAGPPQA